MANEERQLDPNAYATKLDLAQLRTELKGEISSLRTELESKIAEVRIAVAGLDRQMTLVIAFLAAILVGVFGIIIFH